MKPRHKKLAPFVPLDKATIKTPAWKALSHGARSLYATLKAGYNTKLQNGVYLSTRKAAKEMGSTTKESAGRWFHELQYYGFIVMVTGPCLGVEGHGKAPHYRLTEEWYLGKPPTREFMNWDGEKYHEQKPPSYYQRKKQNPVSPVQDTVSHPYKTVPDRIGSNGRATVSPVQDIQPDRGVSPVQDITSLTTPCPVPVLSEPVVVFQPPAVRPSAQAVAEYLASWAKPEWSTPHIEEIFGPEAHVIRLMLETADVQAQPV